MCRDSFLSSKIGFQPVVKNLISLYFFHTISFTVRHSLLFSHLSLSLTLSLPLYACFLPYGSLVHFLHFPSFAYFIRNIRENIIFLAKLNLTDFTQNFGGFLKIRNYVEFSRYSPNTNEVSMHADNSTRDPDPV